MKVAFVLGTTAGGTLRHVQMLAAGCAARGVPALVCGPAEHAPDFPSYQTVQFGDRPSVRDGRAVLQLRRILSREQPDVVHAHGLRAGALAALALSLATRPSRAALPLVVTVHNAPPASGANATVYQGLQFLVARSAAAVLCVSRDLEDRMRGAGARDVPRALVPPYDPAPAPGSASPASTRRPQASTGRRPAWAVRRAGRAGPPLDPGGVARLAPQKGLGPLIEAAARLAGPVSGAAAGDRGLRSAAGRAGRGGRGRRPVRALPRPARRRAVAAGRGRPVRAAQPVGGPAADRAGDAAGRRPIVATRAGGIPDLTGEDAALLVPPETRRR